MTINREKIIQLARSASINLDKHNGGFVNQSHLIAFYHAAQREAFEAAAKLCDELAANGVFYKDYAEHAFAGDCAAAIREMAKEKQNAD